ncbi:MAG: thioredoxin domain-containing protein [Patescibacteria group bacterium]
MSDEVSTATSKPTQAIALKDLLIPLSVIIAGIAIGLGLYFGASSAKPAAGVVAKDTPKEAPAADTSDKIDPVTEADHIKGNLKAPIKIVEYSDFECPFCKRNHETLLAVMEKYGDQVAWVYRQFPLEQLHKKAMPVAIASECVSELGGDTAFWTFTDRYFEETLTNDRTDIDTVIPKLVAETGVNTAKFNECYKNQSTKAAVEADVADAVETGGRGTPWSILIGPDGKTYPINGAQPVAAVEQAIEAALSAAK